MQDNRGNIVLSKATSAELLDAKTAGKINDAMDYLAQTQLVFDELLTNVEATGTLNLALLKELQKTADRAVKAIKKSPRYVEDAIDAQGYVDAFKNIRKLKEDTPEDVIRSAFGQLVKANSSNPLGRKSRKGYWVAGGVAAISAILVGGGYAYIRIADGDMMELLDDGVKIIEKGVGWTREAVDWAVNGISDILGNVSTWGVEKVGQVGDWLSDLTGIGKQGNFITDSLEGLGVDVSPGWDDAFQKTTDFAENTINFGKGFASDTERLV